MVEPHSHTPPAPLLCSPSLAATHVAGFCSSRVKPQLSGFLKCQLFFAEQTRRGSDRARGSIVLVVVAASVLSSPREGTIGRDGARFRAVHPKKKERGKKKKAGLRTDWLAPQLGPQTPSLRLMGKKAQCCWYACVQLHQGYFYLNPDGTTCCSLEHCVQRWPRAR